MGNKSSTTIGSISIIMYNRRSIVIAVFGVIMCAAMSSWAQHKKISDEYLERSRQMYDNIWRRYRVINHPNMLSEFYPSKKDSLDYFQGGKVEAKDVSFLWPFSGMVSATNALMKITGMKGKYKPYLDSLTHGLEAYLDTTRKPEGYQAYPPQLDKSDRYYDDNGLVGIEYAEAYLNTRNPVYLQHAKTAFNFIISGWSDELGGGVYWVEGHYDQKPACSNGMAMLTALKIYKATGDSKYLDWGLRFYDWMHRCLRNDSGLYWNDKSTKGEIHETLWSYNSGSMLQASVMLYHFTHDKKYLDEAELIAKNAEIHFKGVKHDPHLILQIDLPWFMTVLFKGYQDLYEVDGNYKYIGDFEHDIQYAWNNSRDGYGLVTHDWTSNQKSKPKWLMDETCIAELYARLSLIKRQQKQ